MRMSSGSGHQGAGLATQVGRVFVTAFLCKPLAVDLNYIIK